jgi:hypothetical protein
MLITPEMVQAARAKLVREVPVVLIVDEAEDIIIDYTVSQLQRVLSQLDEMAPLPPPGSAEALANHQAWMDQSEHISDLAREAKCMALTIVPDEVQKVLHAISARQLVLMGITLA